MTRSSRVSKLKSAASSPGLQRAEDVPRRLPRVDCLRADSHAAADVEEHRELDRPVGLCAEVENRPGLPGFGYDEILPLEIPNEAPFSIPDDGAHRHDVDRRSKCGDRRLLSESCAASPGWGAETSATAAFAERGDASSCPRYSKELAKF